MTGSKMISKMDSPMTSRINRICPSRDGRRLLVGCWNGSAMMWSLNAEDMAGDRPVAGNTQYDNRAPAISLSRSGKIAATMSGPDHVGFRDTTTGEVVGRADIEYHSDVTIAFSPDDKQVAFGWEDIAIYDVMHLEKTRVSFRPWLRGRRYFIRKVAFQTCDDLVVCAKLDNLDSHSHSHLDWYDLLRVWGLIDLECASTNESDPVPDALLQVWHLTDLERTFSLDLNIPNYSGMFLAPDGLTVVIISDDTVLCYSWNHNNAQFDPFHFTDEAHLVGFEHAYSPDGKLVACQSLEDSNIRFWDTRTGQICGKPITSDSVNTMVLSPALKDQSLGDRIICSNIISVYDIHTSHLYARFYASAIPIGFTCVPFMQGGTKLAFNDGQMGIWDLRAGYSHGRSFILKVVYPERHEKWMDDESGQCAAVLGPIQAQGISVGTTTQDRDCGTPRKGNESRPLYLQAWQRVDGMH